MQTQEGKVPLVIFGTGDIAQLAWFYFTHDSAYEVIGFTVDAEFAVSPSFCGLPVHPFEELAARIPTSAAELFVALSYSRLNKLRAEKYAAGKALGYRIASYVSSRATVFAGFEAGENCFVLEDNTIQPFASIGDNVTLWSGNHVGHHSRIEDHCFVSSHVVISGGTSIGEYSFVGVNATLRDHVRIGKRNVVGAGALVLADTPDDAVLIGQATELSRVPSHRLRKI